MKAITTVTELRSIIERWRSSGETVALVPTMGFFHEGHLSLMRCAKKECDRVVTSLFVNPMQFGPNEDLDQYPRSFERDFSLAEKEGVDILFSPSDMEVYGENYQTTVRVEKLSTGLCGNDRPGHFDGVATVVAKLFNMVTPQVAVFGKKDFQQLALIKQLVKDLNFNVRIIGHPIVREADGLAMSSRNKYLEGDERKVATCLYAALQNARLMYKDKTGILESAKVEAMARSQIEQHSQCKTDYATVVHQLTLEPMAAVDENSVLALAVKVNDKVRLIDNGLLCKDD